jgi:hypothetical protein
VPLLTFHTRLLLVLDAAVNLKADAAATAERLTRQTLTLGQMLDLATRYASLIDTVCVPYEGDTELGTYADSQFGVTFGLLARIAGVRQLLEMAIAAVATCTDPYTIADLQSGSTVLVEGNVVSAPVYAPDATAGLQAILNMIYNAIPE